MERTSIRNLIFDFGGVIIDIDFQRTINAFKELGSADFDKMYGKAAQSGMFDKLDRGELSKEEFLDVLAAYLPAGTARKSILNAWNKIIIGIPENRIRLLESLRPHYKTILLSNTNIIHYELYMPDIKEQYGYDKLESLFDHVFLSFRLGMRKPGKEIFDHVFRHAGIKKEESLFMDDSLHITKAAMGMGIPSVWLKDGMDVCDLFEKGRLKDLSQLMQ